ncbi:MAG: SDR family oxidoreductase [Anaerolineales bacterium]
MSIALVTGATSGIGRAIAYALASGGHHVLALGRNAEGLAELAKNSRITPLAVELTDRAAVQQALAKVEVDILVNNAGMMPPLGPFHTAQQEDIDTTIAANFVAQVAVTRLIVPGMIARQRGHIFFTGSTAGHTAFPNMAVYCATKFAIRGFAQALRLDLADHGIRVTEIVAGRVETNLYLNILSEEKRKAMYANDSAAQPKDVADMVLAVLALPQSVDVTRFDILPTRQSVATTQLK